MNAAMNAINDVARATGLVAALALLFSQPISGQEERPEVMADEPPAVVADDEADPAVAADDSWISISGTVTSTSGDRFRMDYGDGLVMVDMRDWPDWADRIPLGSGDAVTVRGEVDDNVFVEDRVVADRVYVEDVNSVFVARPGEQKSAEEQMNEEKMDEKADDGKPDMDPSSVDPVVTVGHVDYVGTVHSTEPLAHSFTIDTGEQEVTVDTDALRYDPLDDEGFQKIEVGDLVLVEGRLNSDFFANNDLIADRIVTLRR